MHLQTRCQRLDSHLQPAYQRAARTCWLLQGLRHYRRVDSTLLLGSVATLHIAPCKHRSQQSVEALVRAKLCPMMPVSLPTGPLFIFDAWLRERGTRYGGAWLVMTSVLDRDCKQATTPQLSLAAKLPFNCLPCMRAAVYLVSEFVSDGPSCHGLMHMRWSDKGCPSAHNASPACGRGNHRTSSTPHVLSHTGSHTPVCTQCRQAVTAFSTYLERDHREFTSSICSPGCYNR